MFEERRIPFQYASELAKFDRSFRESLGSYLDKKRAEFMPAENAQAFRHGTAWKSDASEDVSEMQTFEHGLAIKFDEIIGHDIGAMTRIFNDLANSMHTSFMKMVYSEVGRVANAVGNTTSVKASGSHAQAFLEMLKKIEFGTDRHGNPSLPAIHASPEMVDTFLKDLQEQGPEFEKEVERIKKEKIDATLKREQQRLAKFKGKKNT